MGDDRSRVVCLMMMMMTLSNRLLLAWHSFGNATGEGSSLVVVQGALLSRSVP